MRLKRCPWLAPLILSMALHVAALLSLDTPGLGTQPEARLPAVTVALVPAQSPPPPRKTVTSVPQAVAQARGTAPGVAMQAAPAAPSAEDWAFAAKYTLKNSKGYRHNWGRQVRSMMGTAVEGPDQGMVRFRIEIAPDGTLSRLDTLWSTSDVAERKAREAVRQMPALPPTPTGKPLVFEKTIVFSAFATDDTPLYRHDCDPEVPAFRNPFVWDGQSSKMRDDDPPPPKVMTAQELEDCRKQLPPETVQSESARDQRVMERWGTTHTGQPPSPP